MTADANTGYAYRVRAETSDYRSDWSNEITVTTSGPPAGVTVKAEVPTEATAPDTRVLLGYHLPEGLRLDRNPFFVVVDPSGALLELRPAYLTQPPPDAEGYLDLHSELYPAGVYRVRAQLSLRDPGDRPEGAASSWMPLTVPPPALASLTVGAVVMITASYNGSSLNAPLTVVPAPR